MMMCVIFQSYSAYDFGILLDVTYFPFLSFLVPLYMYRFVGLILTIPVLFTFDALLYNSLKGYLLIDLSINSLFLLYRS